MTKKVVAFVLAFVFCFGCAAVFATFGDGQLHVHAAEEEEGQGETTIIDQPTVFIRYKDGVSGPVYDFVNKTLTLRILIWSIDKANCSHGRVEIKYDDDMFDFSSVSGDFMGIDTSYEGIVSVSDEDGVVSISVVTDSSEPYTVGSQFDVKFSFAGVDINTLEEREKSFDLDFYFSGSLYKNTDNRKSKVYTALLCPHNAADVETKDFAATCDRYAHTDTICNMCGSILDSVTTGNTYGSHVYDYENVVRYIYSSDQKDCDITRENRIVAEVKCQVCQKLQWVHDLEYHIGLDTSVKRYDEISKLYYYTCAKDHKVIAKIQAPGTSNPDSTHEHTYGPPVVTKQPTCTENGEQVVTCTICNEQKKETIAATGHKFGDPVVTKQPTCTEAGEQVRTCTVCGEKSVPETTPALGHDFEHGTITAVTPATCASTGTVTKKCSRCDVTETATLQIDPAAHSYGEWITTTLGTCVSKEVKTHTCSLCGQSESEEFDFGDHEYTSQITTAPTCYEDGVRTYTCKHCGDTYDETEKCTGHKFGTPISDGKGTTTVTCTECGMIVTTTVKSNKITKSVSDGPFTLTIKDSDIAQKDIQLRVTEIERSSEEFITNSTYVNALNSVIGKNYSIQNAYHVTLYIDGVESNLTEDMTLALALNNSLSSSKTGVIYYIQDGAQTKISSMNEASRKKLVVTMPGKALAKSASDIIILAVEGASVNPSSTAESGQTPVTPPPAPSGDGGFIVPAIIIGVAIVATLVIIVLVIRKSKKDGYDF